MLANLLLYSPISSAISWIGQLKSRQRCMNPKTMKFNKTLAMRSLALLLSFCFLTYTSWSASNEAVVFEDKSTVANVRTLGSTWKAKSIAKAVTPTSLEEKYEQDFIDRQFIFDVNFMYEKLKQIELDEDGHIRLNDMTRRALEEGLEATGLLLTDYDLETLKETFQESLPGELGVEAAELAVNFYNYLRAKEQVLDSDSMPASIDGMKAYYAMLSDLRAATLGADRAKRLFGKSENDMSFMLESMALNQVKDLTNEERDARIKALSKKYHQHERPVDDLEGR